MFERFSVQARAVISRAQEEVQQWRHPRLGTEHLLLGMLSEDAGIAYTVLRDAGLDRPRVRADVERLVGTPTRILGDADAAALRSIGIDLDEVRARIIETLGTDALAPEPDPDPPVRRRRSRLAIGGRTTPRARKVLELALREAIRLGHHYIGTEHLLLGLLRDGGGVAARILTEAGLTLGELRRATLAALGEAA